MLKVSRLSGGHFASIFRVEKQTGQRTKKQAAGCAVWNIVIRAI
jgi:hypothetical protein